MTPTNISDLMGIAAFLIVTAIIAVVVIFGMRYHRK
jgi:hypothetical protein